jgi:hypothetical protein
MKKTLAQKIAEAKAKAKARKAAHQNAIADREDVEIDEGFDADLCVPFYRVSGRSNGTGDAYVTCTSRGDLTLSELRRVIREAVNA